MIPDSYLNECMNKLLLDLPSSTKIKMSSQRKKKLIIHVPYYPKLTWVENFAPNILSPVNS
jgi:hypothetical protein